MVYRVLADVVVAVHVAFIVFVAAGALLAWRWTWVVRLHVPSVVWAVAALGIGVSCPLTSLEKLLRGWGGERSYGGGFVDRYLEGVVYPESSTPALWALAGVALVVGYAGVGLSRCRGAGAAGGRPSTPGRRAAGS